MDTILGLSVPAFTALHVAISLIGVVAGLIFLGGLIAARFMTKWNSGFLIFTILTSVTGFFFHSKAFGPPHIVGVISLIVLAVALYALYGAGRTGVWRPVYAITATIAQWFNVFVLITQSFQKIHVLNTFAPNGNEPPFLAAQGIVLLLFVYIGWRAVKRGA
jgi:hypothetical protein